MLLVKSEHYSDLEKKKWFEFVFQLSLVEITDNQREQYHHKMVNE